MYLHSTVYHYLQQGGYVFTRVLKPKRGWVSAPTRSQRFFLTFFNIGRHLTAKWLIIAAPETFNPIYLLICLFSNWEYVLFHTKNSFKKWAVCWGREEEADQSWHTHMHARSHIYRSIQPLIHPFCYSVCFPHSFLFTPFLSFSHTHTHIKTHPRSLSVTPCSLQSPGAISLSVSGVWETPTSLLLSSLHNT